MLERTLTSLSHLIDLECARGPQAYAQKDGAVGLDGQSAPDNAERLDENPSSKICWAVEGAFNGATLDLKRALRGKPRTQPRGNLWATAPTLDPAAWDSLTRETPATRS